MTEYLSGETLAQRIERSGPWSLDHALLVLRGVLEALREIHAAGLAHGGVAPGNVILRTTGPCISGARAPVSDIRCDLAPAMPIPAGRNDEASTTLIDGPPGDLQAAARLFSFMRNSAGAGPGWVSRLRHRLAQTAPDSFRTAGEALDYLRVARGQDRELVGELLHEQADVGDHADRLKAAPVGQLGDHRRIDVHADGVRGGRQQIPGSDGVQHARQHEHNAGVPAVRPHGCQPASPLLPHHKAGWSARTASHVSHVRDCRGILLSKLKSSARHANSPKTNFKRSMIRSISFSMDFR